MGRVPCADARADRPSAASPSPQMRLSVSAVKEKSCSAPSKSAVKWKREGPARPHRGSRDRAAKSCGTQAQAQPESARCDFVCQALCDVAVVHRAVRCHLVIGPPLPQTADIPSTGSVRVRWKQQTRGCETLRPKRANSKSVTVVKCWSRHSSMVFLMV